MLSKRSNSVESTSERMIFHNRTRVCLFFALVTVFLVWKMATGLKVDASFEKMVPMQHPYIQNMFRHLEGSGGGNTVRIAVAAREGDIFSAEYMEVLRQINDEVFYLEGVDRPKLKSLWAPGVRWTEVTEEGFAGGPVIPQTYDGSRDSLNDLRTNILRSGQVGQLVANDFRSSIVSLPLFETNPETVSDWTIRLCQSNWNCCVTSTRLWALMFILSVLPKSLVTCLKGYSPLSCSFLLPL